MTYNVSRGTLNFTVPYTINASDV